jgi:hypothetical protein
VLVRSAAPRCSTWRRAASKQAGCPQRPTLERSVVGEGAHRSPRARR